MIHRKKGWALLLIGLGAGLMLSWLFGVVFSVICSLICLAAGILLLRNSFFC